MRWSVFCIIFLTSCFGNLNKSFISVSVDGSQDSLKPKYDFVANVKVKEDQEVVINILDLISSDALKLLTIKTFSESEFGVVEKLSDMSLKYGHLVDDDSAKDIIEVIAVDISNVETKIRINVEVELVPNSPIAIDDEIVTKTGRKVKVNVLSNDLESNDENISIKSISVNPEFGTIDIDEPYLVYTPDKEFSGDLDFHYTIENESGLIDTAKVSIKIQENIPVGRDGEVYELPMRIVFIMTEGSSKASNFEMDAEYALDIMNNSQKTDGYYTNKYYLYETLRIENNDDGIMNTNEFPNIVSKYGEDGILTVAYVEDIPGGVTGVAHGIMCALTESGVDCDNNFGREKPLVVNEYAGLREDFNNCGINPLGCTTSHELGHHVGYYHLSGESERLQSFIFCPEESIKYLRTSSNPNYTQVINDSTGKSWHIGPHAMRKGANRDRNGGFFTDGYKESSIGMFECYNKTSAKNLLIRD